MSDKQTEQDERETALALKDYKDTEAAVVEAVLELHQLIAASMSGAQCFCLPGLRGRISRRIR